MFKNQLSVFFEQCRELFSSQDSKFYVITATKLTLIPAGSFLLVLYSLWTILEMNYSFFMANGFEQTSETFYNIVLNNIHNYTTYFFLSLIFIFMFGLFTSYLALRAFEHIEHHTFDIKEDFKVSSINQRKLIYQVSRIFFSYIQLYMQNKKRPTIHLPSQIENLKTPPVDKVFLFQYTFVVTIIVLGTSTLLFSFTQELHKEIVRVGLNLLPTNTLIADFLDSQSKVFLNVYLVGISTNIIAYILIAKNIIKTVDGVCYGFARDMVKVIKGKHTIRLKPRYKDPGHKLATIINQTLDDAFPLPVEQRNFYQAVEETLSKLDKSFTPKFNSLSELKESSPLEEAELESQVLNLIFHGEEIQDASNPVRLRLPKERPSDPLPNIKKKKISGE